MRALALVPLMLLACGPAERAADDAGDHARQRLLQREETELLATLAAVRELAARSESVVLYRVAQPLDKDYEQIAKAAQVTVAGYPVVEQVSQPKSAAAPLLELLTNRGTYMAPGETWTCVFEPHHVLVLAAQGKTVTLVICVECGDVQFFTGGTDAAALKSVRPEANARLARLLNALLTA